MNGSLIQLQDIGKVYCLDEVRVEALRGVSLSIEQILVTHDQDIARAANRWVVLHDGELAQDTRDFSEAVCSLHRDSKPA